MVRVPTANRVERENMPTATTALDEQIAAAVAGLAAAQGRPFDPAAYIARFTKSAQAKARDVLQLLSKASGMGNRPVFLSVGGGDGEEVAYLLERSPGTHGVVIEAVRDLAAMARERARQLRPAKVMEVFEGDAQDQIRTAVTQAVTYLDEGHGDYLVVTCHAVLHELYDRSTRRFDPLSFLATIFEVDSHPIWFTYREPGVPEKWPASVLLRADCSPQSLLTLATAICRRHTALDALAPPPQIVGDRLRLHSTLAIEVLAKLFYLEDLSHEIEERSTAVDHKQLTNALGLAMGETARREGRALVQSLSAPTGSFVELWQRFGVDVLGLNQDGSQLQLFVAESQTRVIAWRTTQDVGADATDGGETMLEGRSVTLDELVSSSLSLAGTALEARDFGLLSHLLASYGRAWIESHQLARSISLLEACARDDYGSRSVWAWSHFLLALHRLFSGAEPPADLFSPTQQAAAASSNLEILYQAEFMEFSRKAGDTERAVAVANVLVSRLAPANPSDLEPAQRYAHGVAHFLLGNLLRHGGLYEGARLRIETAKAFFQIGIPSHSTELAHCQYANGVCAAMAGVSDFPQPFPVAPGSPAPRFASALLLLAYSHASWFLSDVGRAKQYSSQAASVFREIGASKYAKRAELLTELLEYWAHRAEGRSIRPDMVPRDMQAGLSVMLGVVEPAQSFVDWFGSLRPSVALGLLQFSRLRPGAYRAAIALRLPPMLRRLSDGSYSWTEPDTVDALLHADIALRKTLGIPADRVLPLWPD